MSNDVRAGLCATLLALLTVALPCATARSAPPIADAGAPVAASSPVRIAEVLHSTTALSRLHMRCHPSDTARAEREPLDRLQCAFATVSLRQQMPEPMATLENYAEILRALREQCRSARPRSEAARLACATCRDDLSDTCLYRETMMDLRKECAKLRPTIAHANPAVAALEERGGGRAQTMQRFCAACSDEPSARCFSAFWQDVRAPARCTLTSDVYELELVRQGKTSTWTGNLGGPCNTQITLAFDERRRLWTYTEVRLTPERCGGGASAGPSAPVVYSSAAQYALPELPAMCERMSFR